MLFKKKRIELIGSLAYPLSVGNAAFIKEAEGIRRTSTVPLMLTGRNCWHPCRKRASAW